ncbi:response regulator transcription factor [Streptomyces venezuelae]
MISSTPTRVLVAEEHAGPARSAARALRREGMVVDVVPDGAAVLARTSVTDYDVVVLARDLPGMSGDEVYRRLAKRPTHARVLLLAASDTVAHAELVARVRALGRRSRTALPPVLVRGDLRLDPARRVATRAGERLALTPKEFSVLEYLLAAEGRVVPADELLRRVWDETTDPFTTTVKATISRLRPKLGTPPVIETVPRGGYRI